MSENNRPAQRPAATRPAARPQGGGQAATNRRPAPKPTRDSRPGGGIAGFFRENLPSGFWPFAGVCVLMLLGAMALQDRFPTGLPIHTGSARATAEVERVPEIHSDGPIRLNEIMTANGGVMVDEKGETSDWIEVANISERPVSLAGYSLGKSVKSSKVFPFPDVILQAGECALVYADNTLQTDEGKEFHAPFRLSSGGDTLMLFNGANTAVDTVNIPAMDQNTAYVRVDRTTWQTSAQSTPGLLNTQENWQAQHAAVNTGVQIAEIVASNTSYGLDENGVATDYVILRNTTGAAVDLSGWYLSDDPEIPRKWRFPSGVSIAAGGTLLVHCDGSGRTTYLTHLHTSFGLSSEGEQVLLSNANGQPTDSATYGLMRTDTAWIRGADGSWTVGTPTAG